MAEHDLPGELDAFLAGHEAELIDFRRDLHAHPETAYSEHRTTRRIAHRLEAAGLRPRILPKGTGLIADIGPGAPGSGDSGDSEPVAVALRADIDALPISDPKDVPYRSLDPRACHACGHDVHTSILLGAGLFLARAAAAGALPGKVRLIFQPAEEVAGGALDVVSAGALARVDRIFALHCDPKLEVGQIGTRTGPITAACDKVTVSLTGPGGHTARPHLTADLVFALGKIVTELPAALSRRVDPRSGLSLVWGRVNAGSAINAIPDAGMVEGTLRCLDDSYWISTPDLLKELATAIADSYGLTVDVNYQRYVPPTVNDPVSTAILESAAKRVLGAGAVVATPQSLGGEDFAWFLESVPGSFVRLGTRTPGAPDDIDIHQPLFDVDERCIAVGVRLMAATALSSIGESTGPALVTAPVSAGAVPAGAIGTSPAGTGVAGIVGVNGSGVRGAVVKGSRVNASGVKGAAINGSGVNGLDVKNSGAKHTDVAGSEVAGTVTGCGDASAVLTSAGPAIHITWQFPLVPARCTRLAASGLTAAGSTGCPWR